MSKKFVGLIIIFSIIIVSISLFSFIKVKEFKYKDIKDGSYLITSYNDSVYHLEVINGKITEFNLRKNIPAQFEKGDYYSTVLINDSPSSIFALFSSDKKLLSMGYSSNLTPYKSQINYKTLIQSAKSFSSWQT